MKLESVEIICTFSRGGGGEAVGFSVGKNGSISKKRTFFDVEKC